jgi:MinD superfamily P-loop ATPase|uniref:(4Fe-4S)-binding protein n=1 Tax=Desulfobacca acetoxidans TaxID=60893 RepID=A0A7C3WQD0_9BACT
MIVCVASGKGGTGKTTVATNLAAASDEPVYFLDCDVEEPNAHLFLRPEITATLDFALEVPEIDRDKCTFCGKCQEICQFNALAILPETVLTFPELCHSCGGCFLVCPENAVLSGRRVVGQVEIGHRGKIAFAHGRLRVGEALAPPLIRRVKQEAAGHRDLTIIDAPPGASCPVVNALWGADFALLVTEPTPFGLNDLELAVGAVRELNIPCGLVINRADLGDRKVLDYATRESLPVFLEIPFDREAATAYAQGQLLVDALPRWRQWMLTLRDRLQEALQRERARRR